MGALSQSTERLPVVGINSNVMVDDREFHVQTEDLAPSRACLVSHVFREGGCVHKVVTLDYSRHLDRPNLHGILMRVMKVFHVKVIRGLQRRRLDSIPPLVSLRPSAFPAVLTAAGTSETPPSFAPQASVPTPPSAGHVWDRIAGEASRGRVAKVTVLQIGEDGSSSASVSWERAVQSVRQAARVSRIDPADPGADVFGEGVALEHQGEREHALVAFARAVQLSPGNARYRAALRSALDAFEKD